MYKLYHMFEKNGSFLCRIFEKITKNFEEEKELGEYNHEMKKHRVIRCFNESRAIGIRTLSGCALRG